MLNDIYRGKKTSHTEALCRKERRMALVEEGHSGEPMEEILENRIIY